MHDYANDLLALGKHAIATDFDEGKIIVCIGETSTLISLLVCYVGAYFVVAVRKLTADPIRRFHFFQVDDLHDYFLLGLHR